MASPENDQRQQALHRFRAETEGLYQKLVSTPLELWYWPTTRFILKNRRADFSDMPCGFEAYFTHKLQSLGELARSGFVDSQTPLQGDESVARRAILAIHAVSGLFETGELSELPNVNTISYPELIKLSKRMRITNYKDKNGKNRRCLEIFSTSREDWYKYPLPESDDVIVKGSTGRTVLKLLFGNNNELLESELPPNDHDYIATKTTAAYADLTSLEADPDGVEWVKKIEVPQLFLDRDLTLNAAFLNRDGLVYADVARQSACTGKIEILSQDRGLYGTEIFWYQGVRLIKNRGLMRLIKTVAENKAESFELTALNKQVDLGIYWLVLARRFSGKDCFFGTLDRMFELGKQTGQVPEQVDSVFDMLDMVHNKFPFYNFDEQKIDEEGVVRWLTRKLIRQSDRNLRHSMHIPSDIQLERFPGDLEKSEIHLRNYVPKTIEKRQWEEKWQLFLDRARGRTQKHQQEISQQQ